MTEKKDLECLIVYKINIYEYQAVGYLIGYLKKVFFYISKKNI
jgi:hypothetical protein